jgi:hypothetical protein
MKFRTTLIAALLLAGFGAYMYFFEHKKGEEEKKKEETEKTVFSVDWDRIEGLKVTNAHGTFLLEKGEEEPQKEGASEGAGAARWRIKEPLKADADDMTVSGLVSSLKGLKVEQVVEESAENLEPFGLKDPEIRIEVLPAGDEKAPRPLLVGSKNPVGYNSYAAWEGENKVLLLSSHLTPQFDKELYDFRYKKLFDFKREEVERIIVLRSDSEPLELLRREDRWEIVRPILARASETEVDQILNKLTTLKADSFVDEAPESLADYGLEKPVWEVEVFLKPDQRKVTLSVGSMHMEGEKGFFYAKRGERPGVVSVGMDLIGPFVKEPEAYREKKVLPFKTWEVNKVELDRKGSKVTLEKKEGMKWRIVSPLDARADGTKMSAFLGALSRLEADSFLEKPEAPEQLAKYGLADPLARVALYKERSAPVEEGKEEEAEEALSAVGVFLLGRVQEEGKDAFYATVEGEDTVCRVGSEFYEESFPEEVDALRSRKTLDFSRFLVGEIEVKRPQGPVVLKRKENVWKLRKPRSGDPEESAVNDLLTEALDLEVVRFVAEVPKDLSAWGLDPAEAEFSFRSDGGEDLGTLAISAKGPEGEEGLVYVKNRDEPWVGVVQAAERDALMDKLAGCLPEG